MYPRISSLDDKPNRIDEMTKFLTDTSSKIYDALVDYLISIFQTVCLDLICESENNEIEIDPDFYLTDILNAIAIIFTEQKESIEAEFKTYLHYHFVLNSLKEENQKLPYLLNNVENLKKDFSGVEKVYHDFFASQTPNKYKKEIDKEYKNFVKSFVESFLRFIDPNYISLLQEKRKNLNKDSVSLVKFLNIAFKTVKTEKEEQAEIVEEEDFSEIICPYSRQKITDGIVSLKCGHIFEMEVIYKAIEKNYSKQMECPVSGCDKILKKADFVKLYMNDFVSKLKDLSYLKLEENN